MYVCTKCKETKTKVEMSLDASRRDGISSWCKQCRAFSSKTWSKTNPDKVPVDEGLDMKRVRVAPGKFVVVSQEMAEKAARVFATGAFTRDQMREMAAAEPKGASGVFLGIEVRKLKS